MKEHVVGEVAFLTFENLGRLSGMLHAVSTRGGGVSPSPFDSLNLGFHVGDDVGRVIENRRRFASAVGFDLKKVVGTHQVHGVKVRGVVRADAGCGAAGPPDDSWACDALVTCEPDLFLMAFSADCPLVLLADLDAHVAGLAHAGWRPAFAGIIHKTVLAMTALGAEPRRMLAAVSPAIGPCCYEVGADLKNAAPADVADDGRFFRPHGKKFLFDLPMFCRKMLLDSGLHDSRIEMTPTCSRCRQDVLFSHRGSGGRTGRFAAVIGVGSSQQGGMGTADPPSSRLWRTSSRE